jgi:hypothetical protein
MSGGENFKLMKGYDGGEGELLKENDIRCQEGEIDTSGRRKLKGVQPYLPGGLMFKNESNLFL